MNQHFEDFLWLFKSNPGNRNIIRLNIAEAGLLWKTAQNTAGPILEIGRRHGGSTVLLCNAAPMRKIFSIDFSPEHHPECETILKATETDGQLVMITASSFTRPTQEQTFGMAFIDGDHTYEGVRKDVLAYWPYLHAHEDKQALVIFHDVKLNPASDEHPGCPGVVRICKELIASGAAIPVAEADTMLVLRKTGELPPNFLDAPTHPANNSELAMRWEILSRRISKKAHSLWLARKVFFLGLLLGTILGIALVMLAQLMHP